MRKLIWSTRALADLARIREFNETRSDEWADHVEARLRKRAESLSALAHQGRPIGGDLRRLSLPDVQYVLVYATVGADILAIVEVWSMRESRGDE